MRTALTIVVVGSGVVGTATGTGFAAKGHEVTFCDVDSSRVDLLRKQGFKAVGADALAGSHPDAYLISVPTPTVDGRIDTSFVSSAASAIGASIASHPGWPLVVVRSTVPPGTTETLVIPALEVASGRMAGTGFGVCMNPEFLRAVSAREDFASPRVIVIGALDHRSEGKLREIYSPWEDVPILAMQLRDAEATKYVANTFNAAKISYFNELHRFLLGVGADPNAAFAAATLGAEGLWNPAYGTRGGEPFDGTCLPKDLAALLGYADDLGMSRMLPLLTATAQINAEMAEPAESTERSTA